jgi:hypothetical protein
MRKTIVLLSFVLGLTALSVSAFAITVPFAAPGTSNIFTSGFATVGAAGAGDGTLAPNISFGAGGGTLTFSGITGNVTCGPFCAAQLPAGNTADGFAYTGMGAGATNITAPGNGISGVNFNGREMFLVGVFLDNNTPSGAGPATLAYTAAFADSSTIFGPLIGQVFDIGNGLTGGPSDPAGVAQTYVIPTTATRLFFGFADANGFIGAPGMYFDDSPGSITGNVNLTLAAVPEPGTLILMGLGLSALALLRKKLA